MINLFLLSLFSRPVHQLAGNYVGGDAQNMVTNDQVTIGTSTTAIRGDGLAIHGAACWVWVPLFCQMSQWMPLVYSSEFPTYRWGGDQDYQVIQFNIIYGVVTIISAIPSDGLSLYILASADAAIGATMIVVNVQKLSDLKNGNAYTNPTFLGMDQRCWMISVSL